MAEAIGNDMAIARCALRNAITALQVQFVTEPLAEWQDRAKLAVWDPRLGKIELDALVSEYHHLRGQA